ncbi:hypothetical protein [Bacillus sp. AK031]
MFIQILRRLGAIQNRLEYVLSVSEISVDTTSSAILHIEDADIVKQVLKRLIIAVKMSHLCGVLSQSLRRKEPPPFAECVATINRIEKGLLYNYLACQ